MNTTVISPLGRARRGHIDNHHLFLRLAGATRNNSKCSGIAMLLEVFALYEAIMHPPSPRSVAPRVSL
jgi:hypothetical protein